MSRLFNNQSKPANKSLSANLAEGYLRVVSEPCLQGLNPHPGMDEVKTPAATALVARSNKSRSSLIQRVAPSKGKRGKKGRSWRDYSLGDTASLAVRAWQLTKYIASMINVEDKYFDTSGTGVTPDWTGVVYNLSNIAQGTDISQRDGDSVLATYSRLCLTAVPNGATGRNLLRIVLFQDMQQDGTDPTTTQILESGYVGTAQSTVCPLNYFYAQPGNNRKHRFKILLDETVTMCTNSSSDPVYRVYERHFKGGDNHILYDASAGADASNREGAFFLALLSDQAANAPTVSWNHRLLYTDN